MATNPVTVDIRGAFLEEMNEAISKMTFGASEGPEDAAPPRLAEIVVGISGKPPSGFALAWAYELAEAFGSRLTLATAVTARQVYATMIGSGWYTEYQEAHEAVDLRARSVLKKEVDRAKEVGLDASAHVEEGSPGRALARIAADRAADLVVVGDARERGLVGGMARTAEFLLDGSPTSLLIARNEGRPHTILAATDGSRMGFRAVSTAYDLATRFRSQLVVQHVLEFPDDVEPSLPPELLASVPEPPPKVRYAVDVGDPARHIARRAADENAGLVVVGSHGKGSVERFVVGSTSRRVAAAAEASVLVVKPRP